MKAVIINGSPRKNSKTNGLCAYRDDLRPVLEKAYQMGQSLASKAKEIAGK